MNPQQQKRKKPNYARTISFLFKLKKVYIQCKNSEKIILEKKDLSKILKLYKKQIKDIYDYMEFIYEEKKEKEKGQIGVFDVKYKLLLCLIKNFYIRFDEDEKPFKFQINSILKIFNLIKLTQKERMDYLTLYKVDKLEDYHGKKIILLQKGEIPKKSFKRNFKDKNMNDNENKNKKDNENSDDKTQNVKKEDNDVRKISNLNEIKNIFERRVSKDNIDNKKSGKRGSKNFEKEEKKTEEKKNKIDMNNIEVVEPKINKLPNNLKKSRNSHSHSLYSEYNETNTTGNRFTEDNLKNKLDNDNYSIASDVKNKRKKSRFKPQSNLLCLNNAINNIEYSKKDIIKIKMKKPINQNGVNTIIINNVETTEENNQQKKNIISKIKIARSYIYLCFCCIRRKKKMYNYLLDEGMRIISEKIDIFNIFNKMYRDGEIAEKEAIKNTIEMSDECKLKLKSL